MIPVAGLFLTFAVPIKKSVKVPLASVVSDAGTRGKNLPVRWEEFSGRTENKFTVFISLYD